MNDKVVNTYNSDSCFTWTFLSLSLYVLTSFGRIQSFIPGLEAVPLGLISAGLMVIAYVKEAPNCGGFDKVLTRQDRLVIWLILAAILSIPGAVWVGNSFMTLLKKFMPTLIMFYIISRIIKSSKDVNRVIWLFFITTSILLISAIKNDLSHMSVILHMYDANDLALVLVCALPFMIYYQKECVGVRRLILLLAIPLTVLIVIKTASRGGFLGLLTIGGYWVLTSRRKIIYSILLIAVLIASFALVPGESKQRLATIWDPQTDYDRTAGDRTNVWKRGLTTFINNPVFGVGIGNFAVSEGTSKEGGVWLTAHNSLLQVAVEIGTVGLFLFIRLTCGTFISIRQIRQTLDKLDQPFQLMWLVKSIETSLIAYMVSAFFLSQAYLGYLYFILALGNVVEKLSLNVLRINVDSKL